MCPQLGRLEIGEPLKWLGSVQFVSLETNPTQGTLKKRHTHLNENWKPFGGHHTLAGIYVHKLIRERFPFQFDRPSHLKALWAMPAVSTEMHLFAC